MIMKDLKIKFKKLSVNVRDMPVKSVTVDRADGINEVSFWMFFLPKGL